MLGDTPGPVGVNDGALASAWASSKVQAVLSPLNLHNIDLTNLKETVYAEIKSKLGASLAALHLPKVLKLSREGATDVLVKLRNEKNHKKMGDNGDWGGVEDWGGWCATAVSRLFERMTGLEKSGDGKDWDDNMKQAIKDDGLPYREEKNPQYSNLPDGSVLVWTQGCEGYGHVCIVVGGLWCSDFFSAPGRQVYGAPPPDVVYVPTTSK